MSASFALLCKYFGIPRRAAEGSPCLSHNPPTNSTGMRCGRTNNHCLLPIKPDYWELARIDEANSRSVESFSSTRSYYSFVKSLVFKSKLTGIILKLYIYFLKTCFVKKKNSQTILGWNRKSKCEQVFERHLFKI